MDFWKKLKKPILALAPMADVTDPAFRRIIAKRGKPGVMWTEFVSADGLFMADELGREKLMRDLIYTEEERPIVAQFFTAKPEMMEKAGRLAVELGFDGVDVNMGCPDRSIEKQGAGAALIKDIVLAQEIVAAAKQGAGNLPVSIKTRIGYNKNELMPPGGTWLSTLLETNPAAITFHLRTRREMSKVPAHWEIMEEIVRVRGELAPDVLILGNGDVLSLPEACKKVRESGCDGVVLGKAIFGNPWLFDENKKGVSVEEKLSTLVEHSELFEKLLPHKSFAVMKKHYKAYVSGWDGAKELRMKLMECENAQEVNGIIKKQTF